ncbi:hypothetical protein HDU83_005278 [Entophlyctis luteolus]|nr:hypothetical protein HDU82_004960 [Entophlyctis luteolus]KAJ3344398.1 hypothetical protein HDU83_005278 [Entophlyctis luteolus]
MAGATIFVAWMNSGSAVISQRSATGHTTPQYNSSPEFTQVSTPSAVTVPSTAQTVFSFSVPSSGGILSTTGSSNFIWAVGTGSPTTPSSASSDFPQHSSYGTLSLTVVASAGTTRITAAASTVTKAAATTGAGNAKTTTAAAAVSAVTSSKNLVTSGVAKRVLCFTSVFVAVLVYDVM